MSKINAGRIQSTKSGTGGTDAFVPQNTTVSQGDSASEQTSPATSSRTPRTAVTSGFKSISDADIFKKLQDTFFRLTGLTISFVETNADFMSTVRKRRSYCGLVADSDDAGGISRCLNSNSEAYQKVILSRSPLVYRCHAGLMEIVVPVFVDGKPVGALVTGQVRAKGRSKLPFTVTKNNEQSKQLLHAYRQIPEYDPAQLTAAAEHLFYLANYLFQQESQHHAIPDSEAQRTYTQQIIHRATEYIKENFRDPNLSLNEVAEKIHLSPFYFSHIFKKELNMTFIEYITRVRLGETIRLLREQPRKSIKEIALNIGYEDPYYFSKVFRKVYKVSPARFRQRFF